MKSNVTNIKKINATTTSATVDGIDFGKISSKGLKQGSLFTVDAMPWVVTETSTSGVSEIKPAVQAVDIDWNEAKCSGVTINTTGQLLSIIQTYINTVNELKSKDNTGSSTQSINITFG